MTAKYPTRPSRDSVVEKRGSAVTPPGVRVRCLIRGFDVNQFSFFFVFSLVVALKTEALNTDTHPDVHMEIHKHGRRFTHTDTHTHISVSFV